MNQTQTFWIRNVEGECISEAPGWNGNGIPFWFGQVGIGMGFHPGLAGLKLEWECIPEMDTGLHAGSSLHTLTSNQTQTCLI